MPDTTTTTTNMNPLLLIAGQLVLKYGPQLVIEFIELCKKKDPTTDEILEFFKKLKSYDSYIQEANIRAGKAADAPVVYAHVMDTSKANE